jgi:hypothetical protein
MHKTNGTIFLVANQFTINVQLENLMHMFCPLLSSWKLYKKCAFSYVFTLIKCSTSFF